MININYLIKRIILVLLPLFYVQVKADYGLSLPQNTTQIVNLIKKEYPNLEVEIASNGIVIGKVVTMFADKTRVVITTLVPVVNIDDDFYKELNKVNQKYSSLPLLTYEEDHKKLMGVFSYFGEYSDDKFHYFLVTSINRCNELFNKKVLSKYIAL